MLEACSALRPPPLRAASSLQAGERAPVPPPCPSVRRQARQCTSRSLRRTQGQWLTQDLIFRDDDDVAERGEPWSDCRDSGTRGWCASRARRSTECACGPSEAEATVESAAPAGALTGPGLENGPWSLAVGTRAARPSPLTFFLDGHAQSWRNARACLVRGAPWRSRWSVAELAALQLRCGVQLAGTAERISATVDDRPQRNGTRRAVGSGRSGG